MIRFKVVKYTPIWHDVKDGSTSFPMPIHQGDEATRTHIGLRQPNRVSTWLCRSSAEALRTATKVGGKVILLDSRGLPA